MTISIIGTGYVGLVTGAVFADFGHTVYCVDIDQKKIESLKNGEIPFYEPGLEELVKRNIEQKRLIFTTNYAQAIPESKVVFICVGTPPGPNGEADLTYLFSAVTETAKHIKGYTLVTIKSTVPIGVEKEISKLMSKNMSESNFEIASCPEFLKEGSAVEDTKNPDRIIIGASSTHAANLLLDLYKHVNGQRIVCDLRSAQMIKYAANTLLATKISFANAIALLCERMDADAQTVLKGVGLDKRIGQSFLNPGVGYGGSCFPKDVSAFIDVAEKVDYDFDLLKAVEKINKEQIGLFTQKIVKQIGDLKNKKIAILGLAFKPNTDDIREAPAIKVIQKLLETGAKITAYDPVAIGNAKKIFQDKIDYAQDSYLAAKDASALLIITEWNEFKELDLARIKELMSEPNIIDGRNIYDPKKVKDLGFSYQGIGRI